MGVVAPRHVGSSQTRARTRVPCISRQILNHCTTREVLNVWILLPTSLYFLYSPGLGKYFSTLFLRVWLFFRFHIYLTPCSIYLLSGLFHLAEYPQDPSMLSKMAQFPFFTCLNYIPLYMFITHLLYPFIHWWTLKLFPYFGYCE